MYVNKTQKTSLPYDKLGIFCLTKNVYL